MATSTNNIFERLVFAAARDILLQESVYGQNPDIAMYSFLDLHKEVPCVDYDTRLAGDKSLGRKTDTMLSFLGNFCINRSSC